jgi:hypothetical protein
VYVSGYDLLMGLVDELGGLLCGLYRIKSLQREVQVIAVR